MCCLLAMLSHTVWYVLMSEYHQFPLNSEQTLGCLVVAFFVVNWYFGMSEALTNPVLGDNFGFDVEYDSYVFVGSLTFFGTANIVVSVHIQYCCV